ncbi:MAG: hypothetical protein KDD69_11330 [Bdellovibrionales bacterium]|nr:hypothetical protein [Bdellovibrionales bacterium]
MKMRLRKSNRLIKYTVLTLGTVFALVPNSTAGAQVWEAPTDGRGGYCAGGRWYRVPKNCWQQGEILCCVAPEYQSFVDYYKSGATWLKYFLLEDAYCHPANTSVGSCSGSY